MERVKPKSLLHLQSRYAPRWNNAEIRRFIKTRIKYESLFHNRLYSTQEVWEQIADEARVPENWRRLKKKWSNLVYKYRKIHFRTVQNTDAPISNTWPFFELLHKYESQRCGKTRVLIPKATDSLDDNTNGEDHLYMDSSKYVTGEQPREIRTYTRTGGVQNLKSTEPEQPLIRVDKSIFKHEAFAEDSDTIILKIEADSDTEVYEIIPSPKQDYPSDPVEYETYEEIQVAEALNQLSPKPISLVPNDENPETVEENHANGNHNQTPLILDKSSLRDEPKKSKKSSVDEGETPGEKKLRREILKCTNVFLKFMKMKYDIDPDPISDESDTE